MWIWIVVVVVAIVGILKYFGIIDLIGLFCDLLEGIVDFIDFD